MYVDPCTETSKEESSCRALKINGNIKRIAKDRCSNDCESMQNAILERSHSTCLANLSGETCLPTTFSCAILSTAWKLFEAATISEVKIWITIDSGIDSHKNSKASWSTFESDIFPFASWMNECLLHWYIANSSLWIRPIEIPTALREQGTKVTSITSHAWFSITTPHSNSVIWKLNKTTYNVGENHHLQKKNGGKNWKTIIASDKTIRSKSTLKPGFTWSSNSESLGSIIFSKGRNPLQINDFSTSSLTPAITCL